MVKQVLGLSNQPQVWAGTVVAGSTTAIQLSLKQPNLIAYMQLTSDLAGAAQHAAASAPVAGKTQDWT